MSRRFIGFLLFLPILIFASSCVTERIVYSETSTPVITASAAPTETPPAPSIAQALPITDPSMKPADAVPPPDTLVFDVKSAGKYAPYGDSYNINRLERPFLQTMKYEPDLDIVSYSISEDPDWYYVSVELAGNNPNNPMEIQYGLELDLNADGFGDTLILAYPPYGSQWTTNWVQVYNDENHDSAGSSSARADTGPGGDGYETKVFDGRWGQGDDLSLAWVRIQDAPHTMVQFAFKKSLVGATFLVGAIADGALKNISMYDYNDHFPESEAGSPLKGNKYYPLNALYAVDNTCWQAVGRKNPYQIAKVCPAQLFTSVAKPQTTLTSSENSSVEATTSGGPTGPDATDLPPTSIPPASLIPPDVVTPEPQVTEPPVDASPSP
jgi:hypothetical protein